MKRFTTNAKNALDRKARGAFNREAAKKQRVAKRRSSASSATDGQDSRATRRARREREQKQREQEERNKMMSIIEEDEDEDEDEAVAPPDERGLGAMGNFDGSDPPPPPILA